MRIQRFAVGLISGLLACCLPPVDNCTPLTTRCNGQVAQICDGDRRWEVTLDCNKVAMHSGGSWSCCADGADAGSGPYTCLPQAQCSRGAL